MKSTLIAYRDLSIQENPGRWNVRSRLHQSGKLAYVTKMQNSHACVENCFDKTCHEVISRTARKSAIVYQKLISQRNGQPPKWSIVFTAIAQSSLQISHCQYDLHEANFTCNASFLTSPMQPEHHRNHPYSFCPFLTLGRTHMRFLSQFFFSCQLYKAPAKLCMLVET